MTLQQAIQSIPDWQSKTAQELHTLLNEIHVVPDPTPYTFAKLGEVLTQRGLPGSEIRSQVSYTMMQIELKELPLPQEYEKVRGDIRSAYIAMSATTDGLSLHLPERQQLIGLLAQVGQWPAGIMEAILSLGVRQYSIYPSSLQEVEAALAEIELEATKQSLISAGADRWNTFVSAVDAWDGSGNAPVL